MTEPTPPANVGLSALDALPIAYNNNGTVTVMGHTFAPLTLGDYADVIEANVTVDEWLSERANEYDRLRDAMDPDDDTDERRDAVQRLNAIKRRDDVELKRRVTTVLVDMLERSDPEWVAPDDPPMWFGTYGIVHRIIQHWDSVPFRGLASTHATNTVSD